MPASFLMSLAKPVLTSLATNWLGNKFGGGGGNQQMPQMPQVPQMNYQDALKQAGDVINPMYDQQIERSMKTLDNNNLRRGFYGQMPGDAVKMSAMGDMERGRAGQMSNLAQQMMQQNQQYGLQQQQLGMQQQGMNMQQQGMNMQAGQNRWNNFGNLANVGMNAYMNYSDAAKTVPFDSFFRWMGDRTKPSTNTGLGTDNVSITQT